MNAQQGSLSILWKIFIVAALCLGISSLIVSIAGYWRSDQIQKMNRAEKNWETALNITEPPDGADISGRVLNVSGRAIFRSPVQDIESKVKVNFALYQHQVELVPFVRPLSESSPDVNRWWVQPGPTVNQNGSFSGTIFVGNNEPADIGKKFQIVILAIPKKSVSEGDTFVNLPFSYVASNIITVKKIQ